MPNIITGVLVIVIVGVMILPAAFGRNKNKGGRMDTREVTKYIIISAGTTLELQERVNNFRKMGYIESGDFAFGKGKFHQPMTGIDKVVCITRKSLRSDIDSLIKNEEMLVSATDKGDDRIDGIFKAREKGMNDFINQIWFWLKDEIKGE
jgi:hypothetical protein